MDAFLCCPTIPKSAEEIYGNYKKSLKKDQQMQALTQFRTLSLEGILSPEVMKERRRKVESLDAYLSVDRPPKALDHYNQKSRDAHRDKTRAFSSILTAIPEDEKTPSESATRRDTFAHDCDLRTWQRIVRYGCYIQKDSPSLLSSQRPRVEEIYFEYNNILRRRNRNQPFSTAKLEWMDRLDDEVNDAIAKTQRVDTEADAVGAFLQNPDQPPQTGNSLLKFFATYAYAKTKQAKENDEQPLKDLCERMDRCKEQVEACLSGKFTVVCERLGVEEGYVRERLCNWFLEWVDVDSGVDADEEDNADGESPGESEVEVEEDSGISMEKS